VNANWNLNGEEFSPEEIEAARVTAYALSQLQGEELAAMRTRIAGNGGAGEVDREVSAVQKLSEGIRQARSSESNAVASGELRAVIEHRLGVAASRDGSVEKIVLGESKRPPRRIAVLEWCAVGGILLVFLALLMPAIHTSRESARLTGDREVFEPMPAEIREFEEGYLRIEEGEAGASAQIAHGAVDDLKMMVTPRIITQEEDEQRLGIELSAESSTSTATQFNRMMSRSDKLPAGELRPELEALSANGTLAGEGQRDGSRTYAADELSDALRVPGQLARRADPQALKEKQGQWVETGQALGFPTQAYPEAAAYGYVPNQETSGREAPITQLRRDRFNWEESLAQVERAKNEQRIAGRTHVGNEWHYRGQDAPGTEQYVPIVEKRFLSPREAPLSTFSIDVDTASYANVRRFLNSGRLPPPNAVRIEELVNYFRYDYPQPRGSDPFSVNMEVTECPWQSKHWLLRVGLKGKEVQRSRRPASNLVFLLDVSGSMADENKLPLLKTAMKMLVGELGEDDRVSIVTYAGEAGLKLRPTRGNEQRRISQVIDSLSAGGSTNGSAGIELAYEQASEGFIEGGTNRVILCTDGDLNVGITSDEALVKLIRQKAKSGVFLTVLGFGEGNLKDGKMERLADNGNGLYAYIDSVREARKVLVEQLAGSTITIAKDVKIQIEFNPAQIAGYRLLGYENRVLAAKDFNNDKKDAGEIGAGHTVTALYELVPAGQGRGEAEKVPGVDPLKYQQPGANLLPEKRDGGRDGSSPGPGLVPASRELLTLKLRYKVPDGDASKLLEFPLKDRAVSFRSASEDFQFAASVVSFGMVLRGSQYRGESNLAMVEEIAASSLGKNEGGYRAEFLDLVRKARGLWERERR
jgi:secreted protein with Ig-like and vWFA domain